VAPSSRSPQSRTHFLAPIFLPYSAFSFSAHPCAPVFIRGQSVSDFLIPPNQPSTLNHQPAVPPAPEERHPGRTRAHQQHPSSRGAASWSTIRLIRPIRPITPLNFSHFPISQFLLFPLWSLCPVVRGLPPGERRLPPCASPPPKFSLHIPSGSSNVLPRIGLQPNRRICDRYRLTNPQIFGLRTKIRSNGVRSKQLTFVGSMTPARAN
jgi:hypothetical protein